MVNLLPSEPPRSDIERFESLNLTLVTMLEKCLRRGDHEQAERVLHHISWNEAQIERLKRESRASA